VGGQFVCKYRGRVIGWLVTGPDGFLRYEKEEAEDENFALTA
jgi:hypothetical protein